VKRSGSKTSGRSQKSGCRWIEAHGFLKHHAPELELWQILNLRSAPAQDLLTSTRMKRVKLVGSVLVFMLYFSCLACWLQTDLSEVARCCCR
jgi:hypothetical protein